MTPQNVVHVEEQVTVAETPFKPPFVDFGYSWGITGKQWRKGLPTVVMSLCCIAFMSAVWFYALA